MQDTCLLAGPLPRIAQPGPRLSAFKVYADYLDFIPRKTAGRVLNCDELLRATKPPRVARLPKASSEHADEGPIRAVGPRPAAGLSEQGSLDSRVLAD